MLPVHIVNAISRSPEVTAAQQATARGHALAQEALTARETARMDRSHEQVSAAAPEDRLDLSPEGEGLGGGGGDAQASSDGDQPEEEGQPARLPAPHVDFMA